MYTAVMKTLLLVFITIFVVLFPACEIFTGPKVDVFQQISDEVDWAKAPKLTVRIQHHRDWGDANPAQGTITPNMDIRKGYAFEIEFTPDPAYNLVGWRAYTTASLDALGGGRLDAGSNAACFRNPS